jgi:hypothetical protein
MTHRVTLTTCVVAVLIALVPALNRAQSNEVGVQFHVFQDTRSVTVLSPAVDATKDVNDRTSVAGTFGLDAITAASDSCARCHQNGVTNRRMVGGLSVTHKLNDLKLTVGGAYSQERFYQATTLQSSLSRDFARGNTTLAGGYAFSLNRPMLHPTRQVENQRANDAFVTVTQVLSRSTITQAGYELGQVNGYQDNPFLRTNVNGAMVLGRVPDSRTRQTISGRIRQAIPWNAYLEADYRRYFDNWQLSSNAFTAGVSHQFTEQILGHFSYRRYTQTGASFFQPQYVGATPQFFTADFRLSPFASGLYTGNVSLAPKHGLPGMPKGTAFTLQYERYQANNGFKAGIFTTGLRVPLPSR